MGRQRPLVWIGLIAFLLLAASASVAIGPGGLSGENAKPLLTLRLIRLGLGVFAGGVLSLVGAALQGLLQNPLVDPFTLGVASGGALGSALILTSGRATNLLTPLGGLFGAWTAMLLVWLLARVRGRVTVTGLVLAGVIMSFLFSSLLMLVMVLSRRTIGEAVFVMMGHLSAVFTAPSLLLFAGAGTFSIAGCCWLWSYSRQIDIMSTSEEAAQSLGVDTGRLIQTVFFVSSVLVGLVVSFTGAISFVGLVVPHIVRMLLGPNHARLLPGSFIAGAGTLLLADVLARNVVPGGLPLSVVTALIGVPFFIYLLRRKL
ncbi:MAG: iron ABC transporter permease [candidate division WOR-3 bacterium]